MHYTCNFYNYYYLHALNNVYLEYFILLRYNAICVILSHITQMIIDSLINVIHYNIMHVLNNTL